MQDDPGRINPSGSGPKSGTGLAPNLAAALSYFLGLITGVLFVMLEKDSYVRFHAIQSILISVAWIAFWIALSLVTRILGLVPVLGFLVGILASLISLVLGLGALVLWIVLMLKAYQGERWKLPYVGDMAERYSASQ